MNTTTPHRLIVTDYGKNTLYSVVVRESDPGHIFAGPFEKDCPEDMKEMDLVLGGEVSGNLWIEYCRAISVLYATVAGSREDDEAWDAMNRARKRYYAVKLGRGL